MTKQILIVDDDTQTRALVRLILQRRGFQVLEAFDGNSALRLLEFKVPDLLVIDVMMPGIDGVDLCRRLRARPLTASIPIIVFTASNSAGLDQRAREAGANAFLSKTSSPANLTMLVERLLGTMPASNAS